MMHDTSPNKPMVTVITLSYQSEYIYETINSVLDQVYDPIQYIISDDGSEYFSEEDIRTYINQNNKGNISDFRVLHNITNMGTVKNLNQALTYVKGDIILYLSADDLFYDQLVVSDWVRFFSDGKYQIATALRAIYDTNTDGEIETLPTPEQIQMLIHGNPNDVFHELAKANFIFHCNIAFTKQFMNTHMPYDERYHLIEDHPMNLRWSRTGISFGFMDRISIKYRCGGVSSPINLNKKYLKDVKEIYRYEIIPYTSHPSKARYYYAAWMIQHRNDGHFLRGHQWCQQHRWGWILLAIAHPVRAYRKIVRTFKQIAQK